MDLLSCVHFTFDKISKDELGANKFIMKEWVLVAPDEFESTSSYNEYCRVNILFFIVCNFRIRKLKHLNTAFKMGNNADKPVNHINNGFGFRVLKINPSSPTGNLSKCCHIL